MRSSVVLTGSKEKSPRRRSVGIDPGASGPLSHAPKRRPVICAAVCILFAALLSLAILQYSFNQGRLVIYPTYDDCGYLADGLMRLQMFYDAGLGGVASQYFHLPPHSPYSSFVAATGFTFFGYHDWAPYVMNSLLALGYLLLAARLLRGTALWQKIFALGFVATIPLVGMAIHEFRPDHATALLTAAGVLMMFCGPFVNGRPRRQWAAGVFLGLAMLAKPPMFPQTLALAGASLVLATLADRIVGQRRLRFRAIRAAWLRVIAPLLLIPLPHYLLDRHAIGYYIYECVFGSLKDSYTKKGSFLFQLRYYLDQEGGRVMLGHFWWMLVALIACMTGLLMLRGRKEAVRAGGLLAVVFMAYSIAALNALKQQFFGLGFQTLFVFSLVFLLARCLVIEQVRHNRVHRWASILLVVLALGGLYYFQWPPRNGYAYSGWEQSRRDVLDGIYRDIVSHSTFGNWGDAPRPDPAIPDQQKVTKPTPTIDLCGVGDVNDQVLQYQAMKQRMRLHFWFNQWAQSPEEEMRDFDTADFIVAAESGTGLIADFLPFSPWQDHLLAAARIRGDFRQVGKYTFLRTGRSLYLFERIENLDASASVPSSGIPFGGFVAIEGLGPKEGPFPAHHMGIVHWGLGPKTRLAVTVSKDGTYLLRWVARSDFHGQWITLKLDGVSFAQPEIPGSLTEFTAWQLPIHLNAGDHELEIDYSRWHSTDSQPRPMAVLFKELSLEPMQN